MHTRHTHTTSAVRNTQTSQARPPTAPRLTIRTENITYFNTPRKKNTQFLTTSDTQQTSLQTTTQSLQQT